MELNLFTGLEYTAQEKKQELERLSVKRQSSYEYVIEYTDGEIKEREELCIDLNKGLEKVEAELEQISSPLKSEIKDYKKQIKHTVHQLNEGGETKCEDVWVFHDIENRMVGLYNDEGRLIKEMPMTEAESQLHINSELPVDELAKVGVMPMNVDSEPEDEENEAGATPNYEVDHGLPFIMDDEEDTQD